jgi:hypothetical protein
LFVLHEKFSGWSAGAALAASELEPGARATRGWMFEKHSCDGAPGVGVAQYVTFEGICVPKYELRLETS